MERRRKRQYRSWMRLPNPTPPKATRHRNRVQSLNPCVQVANNTNQAETFEQDLTTQLPSTSQETLERNHEEHDANFNEMDTNSLNTSMSNSSCSSACDMGSDHSDSDICECCSSDVDSCYDSFRTSSAASNTDKSLPVESEVDPQEYSRGSVHNPDKVGDLDQNILCDFRATRFEVLLMVLNYTFRHGLTAVARIELCSLINKVLGAECIPASNYWFRKVFGSISYSIHFYCSACGCYLDELSSDQKRTGSITCPVETCHEKCDFQSLNNGHFFITLPIKDQIQFFLESTEGIMELLNYRWSRSAENDVISDVFDGSVYHKLMEGNNFLSHKYNLSLTFNTDGAQVFKSTKNSLWHIIFRINELPPNKRFDQSSNLIAGLWFGPTEPNMSIFLSPFVKEIQSLYSDGLLWEASSGEIICSKIILLVGVFDSIAKPKVQMHHQFNGYYGCSYCYHPGVVLDGIVSNHAKYVMDRNVCLLEDMSVNYTVKKYDAAEKADKTFAVEDRKDFEIRQDMRKVEELKENSRRMTHKDIHVRGVKGLSPLFPLLFFDLVFGFAVDYMHGVLLGVCRTITGLWLDKDSDYFIGDVAVKKIERRLETITPPSSISRRPRPLSDRIHWKANEWRSWLLYYCLPCCVGIVPSSYLKHHSLLVTSSFTLLKDRITKEELSKAAWYLALYVLDLQRIYGKPYMGYNFHLLLHLGKIVSLHGPLWCYSTFSFESANGFLVKLVKGTKGVVAQIAEKYSTNRLLCQTLSLYKVSSSVLEFCEDMLSYKVAAQSTRILSVTVLGSQKCVPLQNDEKETLINAGIAVSEFSYERFIKSGVMYHAQWYSRRGKKSDDTVAQLESGIVGVSLRVIVTGRRESNQQSIKILLRKIMLADLRTETYHHPAGAKGDHIRRCAPVVYGPLLLVNAEAISRKMLLLRCVDDVFVTFFPNVFEKD